MVELGNRVKTTSKSGAVLLGTVKFVGKHHTKGEDRVGIELDDPVGKHNGTVKGHAYFKCRELHGLLTTPAKVALLPREASSSPKKKGAKKKSRSTSKTSKGSSAPQNKSSASRGNRGRQKEGATPQNEVTIATAIATSSKSSSAAKEKASRGSSSGKQTDGRASGSSSGSHLPTRRAHISPEKKVVDPRVATTNVQLATEWPKTYGFDSEEEVDVDTVQPSMDVYELHGFESEDDVDIDTVRTLFGFDDSDVDLDDVIEPSYDPFGGFDSDEWDIDGEVAEELKKEEAEKEAKDEKERLEKIEKEKLAEEAERAKAAAEKEARKVVVKSKAEDAKKIVRERTGGQSRAKFKKERDEKEWEKRKEEELKWQRIDEKDEAERKSMCSVMNDARAIARGKIEGIRTQSIVAIVDLMKDQVLLLPGDTGKREKKEEKGLKKLKADKKAGIRKANCVRTNELVQEAIKRFKEMVLGEHTIQKRKAKRAEVITFDKNLADERRKEGETREEEEKDALQIVAQNAAIIEEEKTEGEEAQKKKKAEEVKKKEIAAVAFETESKAKLEKLSREARLKRIKGAISEIEKNVEDENQREVDDSADSDTNSRLCSEVCRRLQIASEDIANQSDFLEEAFGNDGTQVASLTAEDQQSVNELLTECEKICDTITDYRNAWTIKEQICKEKAAFQQSSEEFKLHRKKIIRCMKERRNAEAILTRDLKNIPSLKPAQKRKEAKGSVSGPTKRQQKDDVSKVFALLVANDASEEALKALKGNIAELEVLANKITADVEGYSWEILPTHHVNQCADFQRKKLEKVVKYEMKAQERRTSMEKMMAQKGLSSLAAGVKKKMAHREKTEKKRKKPREQANGKMRKLELASEAVVLWCEKTVQQIKDCSEKPQAFPATIANNKLERIAEYYNEYMERRALSFAQSSKITQKLSKEAKKGLKKSGSKRGAAAAGAEEGGPAEAYAYDSLCVLRKEIYQKQPKEKIDGEPNARPALWFQKEFQEKVESAVKAAEAAFHKVETAIDAAVFRAQIERREYEHGKQFEAFRAWLTKKSNDSEALLASRSSLQINKEIQALEYLLVDAESRLYGKQGLWPRPDFANDWIKELFDKIDVDSGGSIEFEELSQHPDFKLWPEESLRAVFNDIDTDQGGSIDIEEFRFFCTKMGIHDAAKDNSTNDRTDASKITRDVTPEEKAIISRLIGGNRDAPPSESDINDLKSRFCDALDANDAAIVSKRMLVVEATKYVCNQNGLTFVDEDVDLDVDDDEDLDDIDLDLDTPDFTAEDIHKRVLEHVDNQPNHEFDFPHFVNVLLWKGYLDGDIDVDVDDVDGIGVDLEEESDAKELGLSSHTRHKETVETHVESTAFDSSKSIATCTAYSEPELSRFFVGTQIRQRRPLSGKFVFEYFKPCSIGLSDVVEVKRLKNVVYNQTIPRGADKKPEYEIGIVVGSPPKTFKEAKGGGPLSSLAFVKRNVFAVRFPDSDELDEFVPKDHMRKLQIEAMSLMSGNELVIAPNFKGAGDISSAFKGSASAKIKQIGDDEEKDFVQMMVSPAVYVRRPKPTKGKPDEYPRTNDNDHLVTFHADATFFRQSEYKKEFAPTNLPIAPLGAYLATAKFSSKHETWAHPNPSLMLRRNDILSREHLAFEYAIKLRISAYKLQLDSVQNSEAQYGMAIANVWIPRTSLKKAKFHFEDGKDAKHLPYTTTKTGPDLPRLSSVSHINGVSVGSDNAVRNDNDITDLIGANLESYKTGSVKTGNHFEITVPRPLGMGFKYEQNVGFFVSKVNKGGNAEKTGKIKQGYRIESVNGDSTEGMKDTKRLSAQIGSSDECTLVLTPQNVTSMKQLDLWTIHRHTCHVQGFVQSLKDAGVKTFVHKDVNGGGESVRVCDVAPGGEASKFNIEQYDILCCELPQGEDERKDDLWWQNDLLPKDAENAEHFKDELGKIAGPFNLLLRSNRFALQVTPKDGVPGFTCSLSVHGCVIVSTVEPNGGAHDVGLQCGDCLTHINDWPLRSSSLREVDQLLMGAKLLKLEVSRPTSERPPGTTNSIRPLENGKGSLRLANLDHKLKGKLSEIARKAGGVPTHSPLNIVVSATGGDGLKQFRMSFLGNPESTTLLTAIHELKKRSGMGATKAAKTAQETSVLKIISDLAERTPGMLNQANQKGRTPLSVAAEYNLENVVKELLERAKDDLNLNSPDEEGRVPLLYAVRNNAKEITKLLLEAGCNPNIQSLPESKGDNEGLVLPLEVALLNPKINIKIARYLLHSGLANIDMDTDSNTLESGQSADSNIVHRVLKKYEGKPEKCAARIDLLVKYGVDLNRRDDQGKSTLDKSIDLYANDSRIASRIILNDSPVAIPLALDIAAADFRFAITVPTPLGMSFEHANGLFTVTKVKAGGNAEKTGKIKVGYRIESVNGDPTASLGTKKNIAAKIQGSKPDCTLIFRSTSEKTCPLIKMISKNETHAVRKLIAMGVPGQEKRYEITDGLEEGLRSQKITPFELAVFTGGAGCASEFIGQDLNYRSKLQLPPGYNFGEGFEEDWKVWKSGKHPSNNQADDDVDTCVLALMNATHKDAVVWAELFMEHGIDFDKKRSPNGINLFNLCVALGHNQAALTVLDSDSKASHNIIDDRNRSALFYAAYSNRDDRSEVLQRLLEMDADPTAPDVDGVTPLLAAARNNDLKSFMILRNRDFEPLAPERKINPSMPPPIGKAVIKSSAVGEEGVCVYTTPDDASSVICYIQGENPGTQTGQKSSKKVGKRKRASSIGTLERRSFRRSSSAGSMDKMRVRAGTGGASSFSQAPPQQADLDFIKNVAEATDHKISGTLTVNFKSVDGTVTFEAKCATGLTKVEVAEVEIFNEHEKEYQEIKKAFPDKSEDVWNAKLKSKEAAFIQRPGAVLKRGVDKDGKDQKVDESSGEPINVVSIETTELRNFPWSQKMYHKKGWIPKFHLEACLLSRPRRKKGANMYKLSTSVKVAETPEPKAGVSRDSDPTCGRDDDPTWSHDVFQILPTSTKQADIKEQIEFSVAHDNAENSLTVAVKGCSSRESKKGAYALCCSLVYANGDRHLSFDMPKMEMKKGETNFTFEEAMEIYFEEVEIIDLEKLEVLFELYKGSSPTSGKLVGVCKIGAKDDAVQDTKTVSLEFLPEIWDYQVLSVEIWSGPRAKFKHFKQTDDEKSKEERSKSSKFLGMARFNVQGAVDECRRGGSPIEVDLVAIDSMEIFGQKGTGPLFFNDIPISEEKDGWLKLHQSTYAELLKEQASWIHQQNVEEINASKFDIYKEGWIKKTSASTGRTQLEAHHDGNAIPWKFPKGESLFMPYEKYKRNESYDGVQGSELNRQDHLGNTVLYYAVLHESFDMVQNLLLDAKDIDVNIICAEGFSAFMLSILIKPRGHLPIFFSFVEQAGTTIDWMQKEDRTERSDPNVDPKGKPNNLIDYALLQEYCYAERPMFHAIQKHSKFHCKSTPPEQVEPTGQVAELIRFEQIHEQERMQQYILPEVKESIKKYSADAQDEAVDPIDAKESKKPKKKKGKKTETEILDVQKEAKGSLTLILDFVPDALDCDKVVVSSIHAKGLETHEIKNRQTKTAFKQDRWSKPYIDIILVHGDQNDRRDAIKRKTKTLSQVQFQNMRDGESEFQVLAPASFALSKEECNFGSKFFLFEVWHDVGEWERLQGKKDVFMGRSRVDITEAYRDAIVEGSSRKVTRTEVPLVEVPRESIPPPLEEKETAFFSREDNKLPAWTNTFQSDGIIKRTWNNILEDEAIPYTGKLVAKLQCMYDLEDVYEAMENEKDRRNLETAKVAAEVAAIAVAFAAGSTFGMGTSMAFAAKFAIKKIQKYAESLIGTQDKDHNHFGPKFAVINKESTFYYRINKESWMKRLYYPNDHSATDFLYKRDMLVEDDLKEHMGAHNSSLLKELMTLKKELFLFQRKGKDAKQTEATTPRTFADARDGDGGMFDGIAEFSDNDEEEETDDEIDDEDKIEGAGNDAGGGLEDNNTVGEGNGGTILEDGDAHDDFLNF